MRVKLRYALPMAQMALAAGLFWWSDRWFKVQMLLQDMPARRLHSDYASP